MNAFPVRAPFRCLRGFLILATVFSLGLRLAAQSNLYTNPYTISPSPDTSDGFGGVVATNGDHALVGNRVSKTPQYPSYRDVFEFARGGSGWTMVQQFQTPNWGMFEARGDTLVAGDTIFGRNSGGVWQGQAVVLEAKEAWAVAVQGDTVAFGIPSHEDPPGAHNNDGAVRVYQRTGTTWNLQTILALSPAGQNAYFGQAVALDGDTLIASTGLYRIPGAVYAYRRTGTTWTQEGSFGFPDQGDNTHLALEGDVAAVADGPHRRVGIFVRSGTTWTLTQTLVFEAAPPKYVLGLNVALRNGILAVATEGDAQVYLFTRTSAGWMQAQKVAGSFNAEQALTESGDALVVGDADYKVARLSFTPRPPAPGSGWRDYDIAVSGGSSSDDGTTVTVRGAGADIWNTADEFHMRSESMTGDGAIIARVTSAGTTHPWAKAGLMFRADIAPASREVSAFVTPGEHFGTAVRATTGDYTTFQDAGWGGVPIWLMLARQGDLFASYYSADGDHWTPMGSATVKMPPTVLVGLAVTSHAINVQNTGTFTNVELVNLPPPSNDPPAAPTNLQAGNQTTTTVTLTWTDNSSDETGFEIQRSRGDGSGVFSVVTTTAANASSFVDSGLTPDTQYTYRLRAVRNGTYSSYSGTFTVQTLADINPNPDWTSADIGNVGAAGSTNASGGAVTLSAGGEDIWNQADGFRFYYRSWTGDGSVTAHVTGLTNTHPWAKAGVMIRASLAPDAADAAMVLTADNVCGFVTRPTAGASSDFTGGPWVNAPYWVRITRSGDLFSGYISPDGATWTLVGSRTMTMGSTVYIGLAACSHNTSAQTTASFDNVTVPDGTPPPPPPPPAGWTQQLWGSATGSFSAADTAATITATGDDIWNNSDSGLYVWKNWNGDAEMVTRVDSVTPTHPWAKAGIMFRAASGPDAGNAFVALTASNGAVFQVRSTAGAATVMLKQDWTPGPGAWLKLKRQGSDFSAYYSIDEGASWVLLGTQSLAMPASIQVGFAVSSHVTGTATTANFSHIGTTP